MINAKDKLKSEIIEKIVDGIGHFLKLCNSKNSFISKETLKSAAKVCLKFV